VAEDADSLPVDFAVPLEELDARSGVAREVLRRRREEVACRGPDAPVVVAQDGEPAPRKVLGDRAERLVRPERLVSILRPGPSHEHHGGGASGRDGEREGSCQADAGALVREVDIRGHGRGHEVGAPDDGAAGGCRE
jgi:hypothetical protein